MDLLLYLFSFVVSLCSYTSGFSEGLTVSDRLCKSMTPIHPGYPQTSQIPYKFTLDKSRVLGGGQVTLRISGDNPKCRFKGFFVQGRKLKSRDCLKDIPIPVGHFIISRNDSAVQQFVGCGHPGGSVSHNNSEYKSAVELKWIAPKEPGYYVLL